MKENVAVARAIIEKAVETTPPKVPVDTPRMVESVQLTLRSLGYVEAGPPLGETGPKTESAILDFRNRNNLPLNKTIDGELLKTLLVAPPKALPLDQVTAVAADIAPKVEVVKNTLWTKFLAKVSAILSFIGALVLGIINNLGDAIALLYPVKSFLDDYLTDINKFTLLMVALFITAAVSGVMWFYSSKTEAAATTSYRQGTMKDDNKEILPI